MRIGKRGSSNNVVWLNRWHLIYLWNDIVNELHVKIKQRANGVFKKDAFNWTQQGVGGVRSLHELPPVLLIPCFCFLHWVQLFNNQFHFKFEERKRSEKEGREVQTGHQMCHVILFLLQRKEKKGHQWSKADITVRAIDFPFVFLCFPLPLCSAGILSVLPLFSQMGPTSPASNATRVASQPFGNPALVLAYRLVICSDQGQITGAEKNLI